MLIAAAIWRDILWLSGGVEEQYGMSYMLAVCSKLVGALFDLAQFASQLGVFGSQGGPDMRFGHAAW
jgi:hypothetical protein